MTIFKLNKGFISEKIEGKITIFDGEESMLYTFNETASFIFQKIKSGLSEKQITISLVKKFNVSENKAKKDLQKYLKELIRLKIISK